MQVLYRFSVLNNIVLLYLKKHIFKYSKSIILLLGISLISSSIVVLQPLLMQKLIDNAFVPKNLDALYLWASLIIILGFIGISISSYNQYSYTSLSTKLLFNFRSEIFEKIFFHKKIFFQKFQTGDLLSRLEGDISVIQRFGLDSIFSLTTAFFGLIGSIIIMYSFNPLLCFFSLCLLPIEFLILKPLYPKMGEKTQRLRESSAYIGSFMIESLRYILFLKVFNSVSKRVDDLNKLQDENRFKILDQQKLQIVFSQIPVIISLMGRTFIVFWGGIQVIESQMLLGEFIAFLTYFGIILGPIQTFLGFLNSFPKVKVSIERINLLIPKVNNNQVYKELINEHTISFENVSFAYENNENIFENLNLKVEYGKKIIITGKNGSGKSTLIDILLNLADVKNGEIKISNIKINEIDPIILYKVIGRVEQHPIILGTSLEENLRIAKEDATKEELLKVLEEVDLLLWYKNLEYGLKTKLSEHGESLSGGQRQRLSIARLILKNPSIIILDEYTSSLDSKFSLEIGKLIDEIFFNKTRIIISHNLNNKNAIYYKIEDKKISLLKEEKV